MQNSGLFAFALLGVITLWGFTPTESPAQSPTVETLVDRGVQAGTDEELLRSVVAQSKERGLESNDIAELLDPAVQTAEKKNPARPILMSTLEGLAKNVPTDRLGTHLETMRQRLDQAGQIVSQWNEGRPSPEEGQAQRAQLIESVAKAQERGLPMDEIQQLRDALQERGRNVSPSLLAVAIEVAPDLGANSNGAVERRQLLAVAVEAGYDETDLRALSEIARATPSQNRPASAQMRGAARSIKRGASVAEIQTEIFSNMAPEIAPGPSETGSGAPAGLDMSSRIPVQPPRPDQKPPVDQDPPNGKP